MSAIDHVRTLHLMALKDITALKAMTDEDFFADEIFGFHAQQAVEKSLKAWIAAIGGTFGFTHDVRILLLTLRELGCDVSPFRDLVRLNVYAVQFRYEPLEPMTTPIDRSELIARVEEVYHVVSRVVNRLTTQDVGSFGS
jgi:HEPN domain-containing protein